MKKQYQLSVVKVEFPMEEGLQGLPILYRVHCSLPCTARSWCLRHLDFIKRFQQIRVEFTANTKTQTVLTENAIRVTMRVMMSTFIIVHKVDE